MDEADAEPAGDEIGLRECDGALCSGDAADPAAGDLRVRYRVVPAGECSLVGVQQGDRLVPDAAR